MKSLQPRAMGFSLGGLDGERLAWSDGEASIRDVLWNILLTRPGERVMRPEFGAGLSRYLHQPNNETTRRLIADVAHKAIRRWEPRIEIVDLRVTSRPGQPSEVILTLDYRLLTSGQRELINFGLQLQS